MDNEIIQIYRKIPLFGEQSISVARQSVLDVGEDPKWGRVKRKAKAVFEGQPVKTKVPKNTHSKKVKSTAIHVELQIDTLSDVHLHEGIQIGDVVNTSEIPTVTLEKVIQPQNAKVSTPIATTLFSIYV